MGKAVYSGVYDNMEFPKYKFQEFPKWVTVERDNGDKIRRIVESQKEYLAIIDQIVPVEDFKGVQDQLTNSETELKIEREKRMALEKELEMLRAGKLAVPESFNKLETSVNGGKKV